MIRVKRLKQLSIYTVSSLLILFVPFACTYTIQQSTEFSDAGIKYTEAVDELLQVAEDTIIEDDSNMLLYLQDLTLMEDKKKESGLLEKRLKQHDKEVLAILETLAQFRRHTRMLNAYFANLQALAHTDAPGDTAKAVGQLSASIDNARLAFEKSEKIPISEAEGDALSDLTGLVSKGVQSSKLREALERDAPIIGGELLLHEKLLTKLAGILEQSAKKRFVAERKVKVLKPYKSKEIENKEEWKKARESLLKSVTTIPTLETATEAARQMGLVWKGILEGRTDVTSIQLLLADINDLTAALGKLKAAAQQSEEGSNE
jgi:hypothetical protein